MNTHDSGALGEEIARKYLKKQGYKIMAANYRASRFAEIDIVALHKGITVFIEVKLRNGVRAGTGREAVNKRKQGNIRYAAQHYMCTVLKKEVPCRFDVVEITMSGGEADIQLIQNAF